MCLYRCATDSDVAFVLYEQILPDDPFGRTMCDNLRNRGCPLRSIDAHPTLQAQEQRFLSGGWAHAYAVDMISVHVRVCPFRPCGALLMCRKGRVLDRDEVKRIERLELFDEFEEWHLIQSHYCICLAGTSERFLSQPTFSRLQAAASCTNT